ncbi:tetratricopeptide repeat protein [Modestobacter sp. SYSU DS0511]
MTRDGAAEAEIDDLINRGCDLAKAGDHAAAVVAFGRAAARGSALAWFNLGNSLAELRRWDEAAHAYQRAAADGEDDAWLNLAIALLHVERWADAEEAAREALAAGDRAAWATLGTAQLEQGQREEARATFRRGAELGDPDAAVHLAWSLREEGDLSEAQAWLQRAVDAGDAHARAVLACWRWDETRDPALEGELRAGVDRHPSTRVDLADLLRTAGRLDEARSVLEAGALRSEEESWRPLGSLLAEEFDHPVAAAAAYRAGIDAGDLHCHHDLGVLLLEQGDVDGAIEQLLRGAEGGDQMAARLLRQVLDAES